MANKYKHVTVVITITNFGIDTGFEAKDATLNALALDLAGRSITSVMQYFTDPNISINTVNEPADK